MDPGRLFARLGDVSGPVPPADAPEHVWHEFDVAEEFESVLAGMLSRPGEPRDRDSLERVRELLAHPSLRRRLGERVGTAEAVVEALHRRPMQR